MSSECGEGPALSCTLVIVDRLVGEYDAEGNNLESGEEVT